MAHRLQGRTSRPHPAGHQQARIRVLLRPTQGPALPGILPWVQAVVPLASQPGIRWIPGLEQEHRCYECF